MRMDNHTFSKIQAMKSGESYCIDNNLLEMQQECANALIEINQLPLNSQRRNDILTSLFANYGKGNIIKNGFQCNYGFNISIGNNCYFNYNLVILDSFEVYIGNNVFIAPNVVISPVTHPLQAEDRRQLIGGKIIIEDDVWIGANSVILPNVTIRRKSVIGAGAVVTHDTEESSLYIGSPARFVKHL